MSKLVTKLSIKKRLCHSITCSVSLRFVSRVAFHVKNSIRSALVSTVLLKTRTEAMTCVPQIVTNVVMEKGIKNKGEQR